MSYVVPLYKGEQLIGIIGADISTEYIENIVKQISIFSSGKAAVLNSDGTVVYHPNFERGHLIAAGDPGFNDVVKELTKEDRTSELVKYELDGVQKRIAGCKLRNGMLMVCFAPVIEIYKEHKPDLVFLDIVMPKKDGNIAIEEIMSYDKDAIIIIVSSVGTQSQLKSALEAGATDFIQKPINKIQIIDALNKYLGR